MDDLQFFKNLSLNISSSLEFAKAWSKTFSFLEKQMPIEAISLHQFDHQLRSFHQQFLVTKEGYFELDYLLSLTEEEAATIAVEEVSNEVHSFSRTYDYSVATRHLSGLRDYVPERNRASLILMLKTEEGIIGHLGLFGKTTDCFTAEHKRKTELMLAPVSLALMNMLQHRRTEELKKSVDAERQQLAGEVSLLKDPSIVGGMGGLSDVMNMIGRLADKETPALILGETGTGKELIADAIQRISPRAAKPYIKVNCGAIPDSLIDSELFGHQKGSFTGALSNKVGRFEQADGGTLFLDEIGELPLLAQVRLLRVLQNGTLERVGGEKTIQVDVRIIAATNRSLDDMLMNGSFRQDLFYRLNVFPVNLPPLRERVEDIPMLIRFFIKKISTRLKLSHDIQVKAGSIESLQRYSWPGNVRELKNLVERALTIDPFSQVDLTGYLPKEISAYGDGDKVEDVALKDIVAEQVNEALIRLGLMNIQAGPAADSTPATIKSLDEVMSDHIRQVLDHCNGKVSGSGSAAERLKVNPNTLRKKMERLNIPYGGKR